jgi:hypothetical protein
MTINEYHKKHKSFESFNHVALGLGKETFFIVKNPVPPIVCKDGFRMSVQAGATLYCTPRTDNAIYYSTMEIGFPNQVEPLLMDYAENSRIPLDTVYGWVPVDLIDLVIAKHGGIVD